MTDRIGVHALTPDQVTYLEHCHLELLLALARERERLWPEEGIQIIPVGDGYIQFYRRSVTWSRTYCLGLTGPVSDAVMDQIEAAYAERGQTPQIELNLYADLSLGRHFARRGYAPTDWSHCLLRPLTPGESFVAPATGIEIEQIDPSTGFDHWNAVFSEGFTDEGDEAFRKPESHLPLREMRDMQFFLGYLEGEPAGAACMAYLNEVAYLVGASTLEPMRRHGVQTALINRRFQAALEHGSQAATIYTEMGSSSQRNAERHGFHIVYSQGNFKKLGD